MQKRPSLKKQLWMLLLLLLKEAWSSIAFWYRSYSKVKIDVSEYFFANVQATLMEDNMETI